LIKLTDILFTKNDLALKSILEKILYNIICQSKNKILIGDTIPAHA